MNFNIFKTKTITTNSDVIEEDNFQDTCCYIIYTKNGCSYCDKAKDFIKNILKKKYTEIKLDKINDISNYITTTSELITLTNHKTFPWIFIQENENKKFIGGYTELISISQ